MLQKYSEEVIRLIAEAGFELAVPDHLQFEKIGAGCISSIFRVKLTSHSAILVKLTEMDDSKICSELHNREIEFYQWLNGKNAVERQEGLKCPKYYGGYACTEELGIILMKDLSARVCNDLDFLTGFSVGSVLKIVRELAAFQCHNLSTPGQELKNSLDRFDYSSSVRNCLPRMNQIEGLSAEMLSKLHDWIEPVTLFKIQAEVPSEVEGITPTLIHCDLWQDNLLFCRKGSEVDLLSIIDWQCFKIGNPLIDVASILGVLMTPEQRREHTNVVLRLYVDEMEMKKDSFAKPFDMTIEKAHRLFSHAFRWPCVQLMTAVVTTSDEDREANPTEEEVITAKFIEMMRDTINCD